MIEFNEPWRKEMSQFHTDAVLENCEKFSPRVFYDLGSGAMMLYIFRADNGFFVNSQSIYFIYVRPMGTKKGKKRPWPRTKLFGRRDSSSNLLVSKQLFFYLHRGVLFCNHHLWLWHWPIFIKNTIEWRISLYLMHPLQP